MVRQYTTIPAQFISQISRQVACLSANCTNLSNIWSYHSTNSTYTCTQRHSKSSHSSWVHLRMITITTSLHIKHFTHFRSVKIYGLEETSSKSTNTKQEHSQYNPEKDIYIVLTEFCNTYCSNECSIRAVLMLITICLTKKAKHVPYLVGLKCD